jgi:hypothetical protein
MFVGCIGFFVFRMGNKDGCLLDVLDSSCSGLGTKMDVCWMYWIHLVQDGEQRWMFVGCIGFIVFRMGNKNGCLLMWQSTFITTSATRCTELQGLRKGLSGHPCLAL